MKINNTNTNYKPSFKGPLDGAITNSLRFLDTNAMANAVLIDVGAMVVPRTYIDTKKRNKYAGTETFFREFTGTLIVCLSSGVLAKGIAKIANKMIDTKNSINPNSWFSKDSMNVLKNAWDMSGNSSEKYVSGVLQNISGRDGKEISTWNNIKWNEIDWIDEKKWNNINWKSPEYKGIHNNLKSENDIITTISNLIENKNIDKSDAKNIIQIVESRITNAIKVNQSVNVSINDAKLNTSLSNLLRDTRDMGRDIFTNKNINIEIVFKKLSKINKIKTLGAFGIASGLGLTNQYINRKITEKRTGTIGFVGDLDYQKQVAKKSSKKEVSTRFKMEKLLTSAGIIALALGVMKIKNPADFIKKLEFVGPITSGNAIKTVYTATLVGRFLASDNKTELRETAFRDYFGFLNWLVLGGFASKGIANLLDRKKKKLFNINSEGKGIKHWLSDVSLKSHKELAAKGKEFAKKNMWKINLHQVLGLAYSTFALGILLPSLNIIMTKKFDKNAAEKQTENLGKLSTFTGFKRPLPVAFKAFEK